MGNSEGYNVNEEVLDNMRPEFGSGTGMQALNRALTAGSFEDEYPDPD